MSQMPKTHWGTKSMQYGFILTLVKNENKYTVLNFKLPLGQTELPGSDIYITVFVVSCQICR